MTYTHTYTLRGIGIAMVMAIANGRVARAQDGADTLEPLVALTMRRLAIAEPVALAKWESHAAVEDTAREARVIAAAVEDGKARGLDANATAAFFRAEIDANKMVQYFLLDEWRRVGRVPDHPPVDLSGSIRPRLDALDAGIIAELKKTAIIRASAACPGSLAEAVDQYLTAHELATEGLHAMALDRALSATCAATPPTTATR